MTFLESIYLQNRNKSISGCPGGGRRPYILIIQGALCIINYAEVSPIKCLYLLIKKCFILSLPFDYNESLLE